ncbi:MAG: endonuclease MutS2 [Clostridia bacterium]|nr:endonuclease MutS2 [Clostridia bacterium]
MKRSAQLLELDKILALTASYAVLDESKEALCNLAPTRDLLEAKTLLSSTEEATHLLFTLGVGRVEYFPPRGDILERAEKGSTLSCGELLDCARMLRAVRVLHDSVTALADDSIVIFRNLAERLTYDRRLEQEIGDKILSEDTIADNASEHLFSIRREKRLLGERIRLRLMQYLSGDEKKFLQECIVTMRGDRFVIPVKAEYRRSIRGFVHDRSASGATVFIEPEEVLEMNNELRDLTIDEKEEEERILKDLSRRIGKLRAALELSLKLVSETDTFFARAEYGYSLHAVKPMLNAKGIVDIVKGRHPLLDQKKAVPVSVAVGEKYKFLLISGANTGGKTVTLKMCGLFCLMAACGLFVPAQEGTRLSVAGVYCDVGDSQSIEENLSTFSSHIVSIKRILEEAEEYSFVLIDEPGGGTDPEEGQALARAILSSLAKKGCRGIVTTHYSALKEFAYETEGLENGSMEFNAEDYKPLYRLKIGSPGSSNALAICTRLGLPESTIEEARSYLSDEARAFERTLRAAEESRVQTEELRRETEQLKKDWQARSRSLAAEEEKFRREREKFLTASKAEARRIVSERTARAEELLEKIEKIFEKETISESDLIQARTLKNTMKRSTMPEEEAPIRAVPIDPQTLKEGDFVRVGSMNAEGRVLSVNKNKSVAEVQVGAIRVKAKYEDLFSASSRKGKEDKKVTVTRDLTARSEIRPEINLIGMTTAEMESELEKFLDSAVLANFTEVRIVHGMGTGKLRAAVHTLLKKHRRVESFRLGKYGEGESGVTIATLK